MEKSKTLSGKISEIDTQNLIMEWLLYNGFFVWPSKTQGTFDKKKNTYRRPPKYFKKGVPDISGILPDGKYLGIEVKRPKTKHQKRGTLSQDQKEFMIEGQTRGAVCFVADCIDDCKLHLSDYSYSDNS